MVPELPLDGFHYKQRPQIALALNLVEGFQFDRVGHDFIERVANAFRNDHRTVIRLLKVRWENCIPVAR